MDSRAAFTPFVVLLGFNAGVTSGEVDRLARLEPVGAAQLHDTPAGSQVLLEGRVGPASTPVYRSFVAYVRERHFLDVDLGDSWFKETQVSEPFVLELPDGEARIASRQYRIVNPTASWTAPGTPMTNPVRYTGFQVGDQVIVIGSVTEQSGSIVVQAEAVIGGTRSTYLAGRSASAWAAALMSAFFVAVVLIVFGATYLARRRARRPAV